MVAADSTSAIALSVEQLIRPSECLEDDAWPVPVGSSRCDVIPSLLFILHVVDDGYSFGSFFDPRMGSLPDPATFPPVLPVSIKFPPTLSIVNGEAAGASRIRSSSVEK